MEPLYNVYFGGETLPGEAMADVREKVAKLFNANEATLDKLFNGKMHLVKRDCDKATALKYKQALERAGAKPVVKPANEAEAAAAPAEASPAPENASMSAAEKIATLGEVNPGAVEEFDELNERYEFLTTQQADLEESIESLQKAIRKINRTSKERFLTTFKEVNENFSRLFPLLFAGGSGVPGVLW